MFKAMFLKHFCLSYDPKIVQKYNDFFFNGDFNNNQCVEKTIS